MISRVVIRRNSYYDSVALMAISQAVLVLPGVIEAVVAMGTAMNQEILRQVGLFTAEATVAGPSDLVIAVGAATEAEAATAAEQAELFLTRRATQGRGSAGTTAEAPRTIGAAVKAMPGANLALISVPGAYAAHQARQALEQGLHVMLYSDNVPLEAEVALKQLAHEKGLLVMGPDCGTAIIGGVGLGFANAVRRGPIGIVAASGTGAQEISTLIDQLGSGVSHLIGTGGRDLSEAVGARMTLDGLRLLEEDSGTGVIVIISKPPAPRVAQLVREAAAAAAKPVVICFLGGDGALTIDEAAVQAVHRAIGETEQNLTARLGYDRALPTLKIGPGRTDVRGLFGGGTLCDQALMILEVTLGPVACNVHPNGARRQVGGLQGPAKGHALIDLGDDAFTVGRPHPMIDPRLRRQRLLTEAADERTAVILLDLVIGHGAAPDPAGALADAIRSAALRGIAVVASVTGTEADPQRLSLQTEKLTAAGATVLPTARMAAQTVAIALKGVGA